MTREHIPLAIVQAVIPYVNDFKCPQCKAYALYVSGAMVLCRKCAFAEDLETFARTRMKLRHRDDAWTVSVPDIFGGEDRVVEL